jgi:hypothetical protein
LRVEREFRVRVSGVLIFRMVVVRARVEGVGGFGGL